MSETTLLLEDDREIGRKVWVTYNELGHPIRALVEQDADAIIEHNRLALDASEGRKFGDYSLASSMPLTLFEKLGMQDAVNAQDRRYISKVLNNSDYSKFRASKGRV